MNQFTPSPHMINSFMQHFPTICFSHNSFILSCDLIVSDIIIIIFIKSHMKPLHSAPFLSFSFFLSPDEGTCFLCPVNLVPRWQWLITQYLIKPDPISLLCRVEQTNPSPMCQDGVIDDAANPPIVSPNVSMLVTTHWSSLAQYVVSVHTPPSPRRPTETGCFFF